MWAGTAQPRQRFGAPATHRPPPGEDPVGSKEWATAMGDGYALSAQANTILPRVPPLGASFRNGPEGAAPQPPGNARSEHRRIRAHRTEERLRPRPSRAALRGGI